MRSKLAALVSLTLLASLSHAQSFNVDFGAPGTGPSSSYGAAGSPGVWNVIPVLPGFERHPLVSTTGEAGNVTMYMFGGNSLTMLSVNEPGTSGDDEALLDDMLIGMNDPVDVCMWVDGLAPGEYEVITYAITPGEPGRQCRVIVDNGSPGPTMIGGSWPGSHAQGATYARHVVTTTGRIGFHSGLPNGYFQSGMNGFQVRPTADLGVEPGTDTRARFSMRAEPNPAAGAQHIVMSGASDRPTRVAIVDLAGRQVWSSAVVPPGTTSTVSWAGREDSGHPVAPGLYLVRWMDLGGRVLTTAKLARVQ